MNDTLITNNLKNYVQKRFDRAGNQHIMLIVTAYYVFQDALNGYSIVTRTEDDIKSFKWLLEQYVNRKNAKPDGKAIELLNLLREVLTERKCETYKCVYHDCTSAHCRYAETQLNGGINYGTLKVSRPCQPLTTNH